MKHSLWAVEVLNSNIGAVHVKTSDLIPSRVLAKQFSFRRIWQGKGSHTAASKVPNLLFVLVAFGWSFERECILLRSTCIFWSNF